MTTQPSRKRCIVFVPQHYIFDLLRGNGSRPAFVRIPNLGVPESATAVTCFYDACRDAFAMIFQDESFEQIPEGRMIPEIRLDWSVAELAVKNAITHEDA